MKITRRRILLGLGSVSLSGVFSCDASPNDAPSKAVSWPWRIPNAVQSLRNARWKALLVAREKLRPLHERPGSPQPGEWRHRYHESGQTFEQYVENNPTRPTKERRTLVIQPIGPFDPAREKILKQTIDYMARYFNVPTRCEPSLPLDVIPASAQRVHRTWGDKQLHSQWILHRLLKPKLPADAAALIAFTTSDLYPEDGWNYVFGEADLKARVGVWSVYRHGDPTKNKEAEMLALRRALKVAVHETGHMFSLEHCTAYRCVQAGVNNLDEEDRSPLWLCPECVVKIAWMSDNDVALRYEKLLAFCRDVGFENEAQFFSRSLETLRA